ncbi:MAG: hypothetical protein WD625_07220 [Balneolales bacterium]
MNTLKFKTNIKCDGCMAKVKPHLDEAAGPNNWEVEMTRPEKILTVKAASEEKTIIKDAVEQAGYKIEPMG